MRNWADIAAEWIADKILRRTDKETVATLAARKTKAGKTNGHGDTIAGQTWQEKQDEEALTWERQRQQKVDGNQLSTWEVNQVLANELDLGKATVIKSAMAAMKAGDTQQIIAGKLNKEYGRGYSVSSISPYWRIFTTPLSEREWRKGAILPETSN